MPTAVIFDMDGVLSDTQTLHAAVEAELVADFGVALSAREITAKYAGVSDREFFEAVLGRRLGADALEELIRHKWVRMMTRASGAIRPIEDALELVRALARRGVPLAVASGSPREFVAYVLSELGIMDRFFAYVGSDEVACGKPAPDVFLLAAARLHVDPRRCTVIEDGAAGMVAAKRAGMHCIGFTADAAQAAIADVRVSSLRELLDHPEVLTVAAAPAPL